ncbi:MAG TPA: serine/threonine-protein kinase [Kofleriaceae bacterium]|nr:serine/threonine-protein kinase [Kofleriaceae bacterium]
MTTRDSRPRAAVRPEGGREPTQSLSISRGDVDDDDDEDYGIDPSHPSLALGTHEAADRDERTRVESPGARVKTPAAPAVMRPSAGRPPPIPPKSSDDPDQRVNHVLGSYRILELLGKGGMGYVYRAEHVKLGREVALKLLRSDYAKRRDSVARFFQEARTVNRVRHRNIVDVTDFVELDDGTTFIIMEFLRGQSLGKWARSGVDMPRALAVLVQICDGLGAAHHVGVVHRDLKPDNVIVVPTSDGAELVKLLDFGVAKLLNRDDEDVGFQTAAGSVIGTPAYMSPEQAGGMVIDARSDIYSLGAIIYELFCGQPMFRGRSFGEYVRKHLTELPIPPRATANGQQIDPRLEALILRCIEKDPARRFQDILELRDALLGMLGGMETHPPGYGALTGSGMRPVPTVAPPAMQTILPQLPLPAPLPSVLPSGPMIPTQPTPHSGMHASQYYGQYASQIAPPPVVPQPTPWWVWFGGGAVAVAIGVGAAIWYAGRTDSEPAREAASASVAQTQPSTATQPTVTQAEPPVARPQLIELRFDSLPAGGVYADGQSAELCRTPCSFNVDTKDGGPTDRRTFVVRSEGYKDESVVVDLAASKREFRVTLTRDIGATIPTVSSSDRTSPDKKTVRTTNKKPTKSGTKQTEADKPDKPVETKPAETKPVEVKELDDPSDSKPKTDAKKPDKKPTIDPTDLADPFKRHR